MNVHEIIGKYGLVRLPEEGGFYRETYRSDMLIPKTALAGRYPGDRSAHTAIYYVLTLDQFSAMHRLPGDEIFHFYWGDPVEMLCLAPDGSGRRILLGPPDVNDCQPQMVVPGACWQGARLVPGGRGALLGTTVAPGFEFEDFSIGQRADLTALYPEFADLIDVLTRG